MKNALCIVSNSLTTIFSLIAIIMVNHMSIARNGDTTLGDLVDRSNDSDYDMVTPLIVVLSLSLVITVTCIVIPMFTKDQMVLQLLLLGMSCALFGAAITLLVRATKTEDLDDAPAVDKSKLSAMKAMLYLAGSFGVLTGVICAMKSTYKLSKIVNKK